MSPNQFHDACFQLYMAQVAAALAASDLLQAESVVLAAFGALQPAGTHRIQGATYIATVVTAPASQPRVSVERIGALVEALKADL